jgi:hypothetical protein
VEFVFIQAYLISSFQQKIEFHGGMGSKLLFRMGLFDIIYRPLQLFFGIVIGRLAIRLAASRSE